MGSKRICACRLRKGCGGTQARVFSCSFCPRRSGRGWSTAEGDMKGGPRMGDCLVEDGEEQNLQNHSVRF